MGRVIESWWVIPIGLSQFCAACVCLIKLTHGHGPSFTFFRCVTSHHSAHCVCHVDPLPPSPLPPLSLVCRVWTNEYMRVPMLCEGIFKPSSHPPWSLCDRECPVGIWLAIWIFEAIDRRTCERKSALCECECEWVVQVVSKVYRTGGRDTYIHLSE